MDLSHIRAEAPGVERSPFRHPQRKRLESKDLREAISSIPTAVYTVRFANVVYVVRAFQKKYPITEIIRPSFTMSSDQRFLAASQVISRIRRPPATMKPPPRIIRSSGICLKMMSEIVCDTTKKIAM